MSESSGMQIRLSADLLRRLEEAAEQIQQDRQTLIERVLRDYLQRINQAGLATEARRQSLLARASDLDEDLWEGNADTTGWSA